jgi:hypothetical protein
MSLALRADGSYAYEWSSVVSIYVPGASGSSAGGDRHQGAWSVESNGSNEAVLHLRARDGRRFRHVLRRSGSQLTMDGRVVAVSR